MGIWGLHLPGIPIILWGPTGPHFWPYFLALGCIMSPSSGPSEPQIVLATMSSARWSGQVREDPPPSLYWYYAELPGAAWMFKSEAAWSCQGHLCHLLEKATPANLSMIKPIDISGAPGSSHTWNVRELFHFCLFPLCWFRLVKHRIADIQPALLLFLKNFFLTVLLRYNSHTI